MPKSKPENIKRKTFAAPVKQEGGEDSRRFTFALSSGAVDRDRDIISQRGINLAPYKRNPVVLWAHDSRTPPVARMANTFFRDQKLMGSVEFPPEGVSALSDELHGLVKHGFINAVSVGFQPVEWVFNEERRGIDFQKVELMEVSLVPVPSNREALIQAAAKGVSSETVVKWALQALEIAGEKPEPKEAEKQAPTLEMFEALQETVKELLTEVRELRAARAEAPEPATTPEPPAPKESISEPEAKLQAKATPRKPSEAEQKAFSDAVNAALQEVIREAVTGEVNRHTGRLD